MKLLSLLVNGQEISPIKSIWYKAKRNIEPYYGNKEKPQSLARGSIEYLGELVLNSTAMKELEGLAPKEEGLQSLAQMEWLVSYEEEGGVFKYDVIEGCQFTEYLKTYAESASSEFRLPFMAKNIRYGLSL